MEKKYVDSSMIASIGYDKTNSIIEIEFKRNHQVWHYYDVPEYVWYEFESASSVGKYFHANIRGKYQENRIN
jgi:hypothetical protein